MLAAVPNSPPPPSSSSSTLSSAPSSTPIPLSQSLSLSTPARGVPLQPIVDDDVNLAVNVSLSLDLTIRVISFTGLGSIANRVKLAQNIGVNELIDI